jgi:hypothetical protein
MLPWRFVTYVSPNGRPEVQAVVDRYDDYASEAFSAAVRHLAVTPKSQWNEPFCKKLKGEDPLYEIRYKANRCATRALGYFAEDGQTFVVTNICDHKGQVYKPPDAFAIAHRRLARIVKGLSQTIPLQIHGEDFPPDEE